MADTLNLLPCPFCGGAARIESNRDWHRLFCVHDDDCALDADDHDLMYPAQPGYLKEIAEVWNRRASSPAAVPEGALPPHAGHIDFVDEFGRLSHKPGWTAEQVQEIVRAAVAADRAQQGEPVIVNVLDFIPEPIRAAVVNGTNSADLSPYFQAAMDATKAAAPADAPKVSLAHLLELVEQAKALPDWSTTEPITLTPIQIAYVAGKLADLRAAPVPDTGIPTAGEVADDDLLAGYDMLGAYNEWLAKRGPLGVGAMPERIFFAGWLASRRAPVSSTPTSGEVELIGEVVNGAAPLGWHIQVYRPWNEIGAGTKVYAAPSHPSEAPTCTYPKCNCPMDAPSDPNWCARGLARPSEAKAGELMTDCFVCAGTGKREKHAGGGHYHCGQCNGTGLMPVILVGAAPAHPGEGNNQ